MAEEQIRIENNEEYIDIEDLNFLAFNLQLGIQGYDGILGLNRKYFKIGEQSDFSQNNFMQSLSKKVEDQKLSIFIQKDPLPSIIEFGGYSEVYIRKKQGIYEEAV